MVDRVEPQATADLVDEYGEALASIPVQLRSFGRHARFAGPAVTVKCFEDNALLKKTLSDHTDPQGRVLVVDGGGSLRSALVGDLIAAIAVERGWAGIVVHGCIRDSVAINALEIGGVTVRPGQVVHSDEDGIVVLP